MVKKTIAVDIDDVLAINVPAFIAFSNQRWGTKLTIEDFTEDWAKMWNVDHATQQKRGEEMDKNGLRNHYEHFEDALPVLQKLTKRFILVIATARRSVLADETLEWTEKYFPGVFQAVHHAGIWDQINADSHNMTKAELVREIGADYLVDDQPKHCIAASEVGIPAVLFGDYPWNRDFTATDGVTRAHSWADVEKYFDEQ